MWHNVIWINMAWCGILWHHEMTWCGMAWHFIKWDIILQREWANLSSTTYEKNSQICWIRKTALQCVCTTYAKFKNIPQTFIAFISQYYNLFCFKSWIYTRKANGFCWSLISLLRVYFCYCFYFVVFM